ncbi:hypothetical protein H4R33_004825 [Dimargaris cristalligena]|nr:hypothetical protein H4R33_004825 [Dimargaris cristalligena]
MADLHSYVSGLNEGQSIRVRGVDTPSQYFVAKFVEVLANTERDPKVKILVNGAEQIVSAKRIIF